jgi:uncharacterized membrane protein
MIKTAAILIMGICLIIIVLFLIFFLVFCINDETQEEKMEGGNVK